MGRCEDDMGRSYQREPVVSPDCRAEDPAASVRIEYQVRDRAAPAFCFVRIGRSRIACRPERLEVDGSGNLILKPSVTPIVETSTRGGCGRKSAINV